MRATLTFVRLLQRHFVKIKIFVMNRSCLLSRITPQTGNSIGKMRLPVWPLFNVVSVFGRKSSPSIYVFPLISMSMAKSVGSQSCTDTDNPSGSAQDAHCVSDMFRTAFDAAQKLFGLILFWRGKLYD